MASPMSRQFSRNRFEISSSRSRNFSQPRGSSSSGRIAKPTARPQRIRQDRSFCADCQFVARPRTHLCSNEETVTSRNSGFERFANFRRNAPQSSVATAKRSNSNPGRRRTVALDMSSFPALTLTTIEHSADALDLISAIKSGQQRYCGVGSPAHRACWQTLVATPRAA